MANPEPTTTVVSITSARRFAERYLPRGRRQSPEFTTLHKTAELAILIAILESLRDGKKGQRELFECINAKVRNLSEARPDDPVLLDARGVVATTAWRLRDGSR